MDDKVTLTLLPLGTFQGKACVKELLGGQGYLKREDFLRSRIAGLRFPARSVYLSSDDLDRAAQAMKGKRNPRDFVLLCRPRPEDPENMIVKSVVITVSDRWRPHDRTLPRSPRWPTHLDHTQSRRRMASMAHGPCRGHRPHRGDDRRGREGPVGPAKEPYVRGVHVAQGGDNSHA